MDDEPDIRLGDTITLKIDDKESDWVVVGIVQSLQDQATALRQLPLLRRQQGRTGRANFARVATNSDDPAEHRRVAAALEQRFKDAGYQVTQLGTRAENLEGTEYQFGILVDLLLVMTILMALVGGLGLMGTMSINVIERTREIGVMRAIGAATRSIMQIIIVEGVLIGLISWIQAMHPGLPAEPASERPGRPGLRRRAAQLRLLRAGHRALAGDCDHRGDAGQLSAGPQRLPPDRA